MAEHGDGKLALYVWEITDAFLDEVVERKPQTLILSGDLTLEGERGSHEALASQTGEGKRSGNPGSGNSWKPRYQQSQGGCL